MASSSGGTGKDDDFDRRTKISKARSLKLSGGSFKGRFPSSSSAGDAGSRNRDRTYLSGSGASSSSSLSSTSSSMTQASGGGADSSRGTMTSAATTPKPPSGLNRIASSASNIQSYATRYIESIRPKSWGRTTQSSNTLSAPVVTSSTASSRSAGNSRAESPLGGIPQLLTFRTPNRLSPLPPPSSSAPTPSTPTSTTSSRPSADIGSVSA